MRHVIRDKRLCRERSPRWRLLGWCRRLDLTFPVQLCRAPVAPRDGGSTRARGVDAVGLAFGAGGGAAGVGPSFFAFGGGGARFAVE